MKKFAKKVAVVFSISAMMAVSLVGCAKKTECYECEKEKKCHQYEISFMGESEKGWLCKDCAEDTKEMCEEMGVDFKKVK